MKTAQAQGKLLLFGEHAAVWGSPAVGLVLDRGLQVKWDGPRAAWDFPGTVLPLQKNLRSLLELLTQMALDRGCSPLPPGEVWVKSQIPPGSGFGSSAALSAALVQLFFPTADGPLTDKLAWEAEKLFHGKPSGIDTVLALRRGVGILQPHPPQPPHFEPVPPPNLGLVCGAFPRSSNTKTLVLTLAEKITQGHPEACALMDELKAVGRQAAHTLGTWQENSPSQNLAATLAPLVTQAQGILARMGLAHGGQDELFAQAQAQTGALAGKLSGAGAGGAWYLLYPSPREAAAALPFLQKLTKATPQPAFLAQAAP